MSKSELAGKLKIIQLKKENIIAQNQEEVFIADVGNGRKGGSFSIHLDFQTGKNDFGTKASTNGSAAKSLANVSTYYVYLISNAASGGYPAAGDPVADKVVNGGPFAIARTGSPQTITFNNVPPSGSSYYYVAIRAQDSSPIDIVKQNLSWGATTQLPANGGGRTAVSSGAGVSVSAAYVVTPTTTIGISVALQDAVGATLESSVTANAGSTSIPAITAI